MSLSNSSQSSNVFVLSSDESSQSDLKGSKKQNYAAFARKVKHLLQVEQDDLNQLYHKIEVIVRRYFDEHKIVEFRDMYDHIVALKSNSKRMSLIVGVLEKRLLGQHEFRIKAEKNSKRTERNDDQLTSSTHKDNAKLINKTSNQGTKELINGGMNDSASMANTSAEHNRTPKWAQQHQSIDEKEQDTEGAISKTQKSQISPSRSSLTKLNSSFEEYQNRNKQYEQKVKSLMKQLQGIKKNIVIKPKSNQSSQNVFKEQKPTSYQLLQINLKSNREKLEEKSQETIIDSCAEKYFTFNGKSHQSLPNHRPQTNFNMNMEVINQKSKESLLSSQKIVSESQKGSRNKIQKHEVSLRSPLPEQFEPAKRSLKSINLLQYSANISKQIQELKQVASRLQLQSNRTVKSQKPKQNYSPKESQEMISQKRLNNLIRKASEEKSHQPILQIMEHTTSQHQVSEDMIPSPSFKQIIDKPRSSNPNSLKSSSSNIRNSSSLHSSSNKLLQNNKNTVNISYGQQLYQSPPLNTVNLNQIVKTYQPQFPEYPHEMSTVKVIYNPYPVPKANVSYNPSLIMKQEPFRLPIMNQTGLTNKSISFSSINRPDNPSIFNSPMMNSNNSVTSIMHPHLFNNRSNLMVMPESNSNGIPRIGLNVGNRQQSTKSFNNISQMKSSLEQYNSRGNSSGLNNFSNISTSSQKRRGGLNIISPPPKQTQ